MEYPFLQITVAVELGSMSSYTHSKNAFTLPIERLVLGIQINGAWTFPSKHPTECHAP